MSPSYTYDSFFVSFTYNRLAEMERNKIWCWLISCNTNDSNSRRYVGIDRIAAKRSDAGNIHPQTDVVANVRKIHNQAILISKARRSLATALSVHLGKVCGE